MHLNFFSKTEASEQAIEPVLKAAACSAIPFEEMILNWVNYRRTLSITTPECGTGDFLIIGLDEHEESIGLIPFLVSEAVRTYGKYPTLKEEVYSYADKEGYTPDHEWFEKRSEKLGIRWNDDFGDYVLPPRSIGKMVLSYCLSSAGMVKFESDLVEDRRHRVIDIYRATFVFFGQDMEKGWHEYYFIPKRRMEQHKERRTG